MVAVLLCTARFAGDCDGRAGLEDRHVTCDESIIARGMNQEEVLWLRTLFS